MAKANQADRIRLALALGITVIIWMLSLFPADISSVQSGWFTSLFVNILGRIGISISHGDASFIVRKTAHVVEFALAGFLWLWFYAKANRLDLKALGFTLLTGLSIALVDETIQVFVPGRAFMVTDILFDMAGVVIGMMMGFLLIRMRKANE